MTEQGTFTLSQHACRRMAERNIPQTDMDFIERYGQSIQIQGDCAWYLPKDIHWAPARLHQLVAITTPAGHVLTTYRTNGSVRRLVEKLIQRHRRSYVRR